MAQSRLTLVVNFDPEQAESPEFWDWTALADNAISIEHVEPLDGDATEAQIRDLRKRGVC